MRFRPRAMINSLACYYVQLLGEAGRASRREARMSGPARKETGASSRLEAPEGDHGVVAGTAVWGSARGEEMQAHPNFVRANCVT